MDSNGPSEKVSANARPKGSQLNAYGQMEINESRPVFFLLGSVALEAIFGSIYKGTKWWQLCHFLFSFSGNVNFNLVARCENGWTFICSEEEHLKKRTVFGWHFFGLVVLFTHRHRLLMSITPVSTGFSTLVHSVMGLTTMGILVQFWLRWEDEFQCTVIRAVQSSCRSRVEVM